MTVEVFILKLDRLKQAIAKEFSKDILVAEAQTMAGEIARRVRETGILGSGKTHPYKDGAYKKKRAEKGMMTAQKNYEFSTNMWRGFGVKKIDKNYVEIGGRTDISQDKINWNTGRDKDVIIAPTEKEEQRLADRINAKLQKLQEIINATLGR